MTVSGKILKQIKDAFLGAFDRDLLIRFSRESLDQRFDEVAPPGALPKQVHALLDWAERQGCLEETVQAAANEVPGNQALQRAAVLLQASSNRPEPDYPDETTRELSERLDEAYRRKADLSAEGKDTTQVVEEILSLRRRLRQGAQLKAGDYLLDGRFELIQEVGHGGFAQVWKAYDLQSRELVAVKVLHGQHTGDRSRRERFFRGARQMARLAHPSVVRVIEKQCEDGEYPFFVMEYLAGGDFRQAVVEGRLSKQERLEIVLKVGEALAFAHRRGVIHRDVKPHNILLDLDGSPKLTDFDLVRAADTTGGTRTAMLGTFLYASPEAMANAGQAAEPSDVYGLGMTAIFALYGADLPSDVLWELPEFVGDLEASEPCRQVLLRSVARKVPDRFATVEAFRSDLRSALSRTAILTTASGGSSIESPASPSTDGERRHERDGSVLVYVPSGDFTLGTNEDLDAYGKEFQHVSKPEHHVQLSAFWIGKYPVTNDQYQKFLQSNPDYSRPAYWSDKEFNQPNQPVVGVSWLAAKAYCDWAGLHLPTEAQWEAAARGTDGRPYPWGEAEPSETLSNYGNQESQTTPVGAYPAGAGPYGTLDQAGNVWEWCCDEYALNAYRNRDGQTDPVVKPKGENSETAARVLRGGSWLYPAEFLHTAFRDGSAAGSRARVTGFRVCRLGPEH